MPSSQELIIIKNESTVSNTTNRRNIIAADVQYGLDTELIELFKGTIGDTYYFLKRTNLDINGLSDNLNFEQSIVEEIEKLMNVWYKEKATEYEKSYIYYRFLFDLSFQLKEWYSNLYSELNYLDFKIDKRLSFINLQIKFNEFESNVKYDSNMNLELIRKNKINLERINKMFLFIKNSIKKLNFYKSNVKLTLDEVMEINCSEDINNFHELLDVSNMGYIFENSINFDEIKQSKKIKEEKKEVKLMRKMFNKSVETISSFLPKKDINTFISGGHFIIEGNHFNYKVSKKKYYNLLQKPIETSSGHIPYELDLYDKDGEYLANLCITFNGCPILDQILSVYLMIKSDDEKKMLDNCNFYKKSDYFNENKDLNKIICKRFGKDQMNLTSLINSIGEDSQYKKINNRDKKLFRNYIDKKLFRNIFDEEEYNFIFKQEVSWDEMTDYYSIGRNGDKNKNFGMGGKFSLPQLNYVSENNLNYSITS